MISDCSEVTSHPNPHTAQAWTWRHAFLVPQQVTVTEWWRKEKPETGTGRSSTTSGTSQNNGTAYHGPITILSIHVLSTLQLAIKWIIRTYVGVLYVCTYTHTRTQVHTHTHTCTHVHTHTLTQLYFLSLLSHTLKHISHAQELANTLTLT